MAFVDLQKAVPAFKMPFADLQKRFQALEWHFATFQKHFPAFGQGFAGLQKGKITSSFTLQLEKSLKNVLLIYLLLGKKNLHPYICTVSNGKAFTCALVLMRQNLANSKVSQKQSNGECSRHVLYSLHSLVAFIGFEGKRGVLHTSAWGFRRCSFRLTGQCESLDAWNGQ